MRRLRAAWVCLVPIASLASAPLAAVDFVVTRYDDPSPSGCLPGDCSLREAALAADAALGLDRILLSAGTYDLTRFGADDDGELGDLDIHDDLEILGVAANLTTISAEGLGTLSVEPVISLFADSTLRDLQVTGSQDDGVRIFAVDVTIERCEIFNNSFQGAGWGVRATGDGALVVRDSAIINNGNGLHSAIGDVTLENVTLHSNNGFQLSVANGSLLTMRHCTVVDVVGGNGELRVDSSIALVQSSIVRGNCQLVNGGVVGSQGANVESPGDTCFFVLGSDREEVADPGLSDLGNHGGATRTFGLLAGSPAHTLVAEEDCATHDQRGVPRSPHPFESCDAGAFEIFSGPVSTPLFIDGFRSGNQAAWSD